MPVKRTSSFVPEDPLEDVQEDEEVITESLTDDAHASKQREEDGGKQHYESSDDDLEDFVPQIRLSSRKRSQAQQAEARASGGGSASRPSMAQRMSMCTATQSSIIETLTDANKAKMKILRRFTGKINKSAAAERRIAQEYDPFENVDPSKWTLVEAKFDGRWDADKFGQEEKVKKQSIRLAIKKFKEDPTELIAMCYQTDALEWPVNKQKYELLHRKGTEQFRPRNIKDNGWMTLLWWKYHPLAPLEKNLLPVQYRDKYTDTVLAHWAHKQLSGIHDDSKNPPILPGRGMGCVDTPAIKIIGDVDPEDVEQGFIGDCWMLSAISSLAEFDGAIRRLFRKTPNLDKMPQETPNKYIVSLWDLETWKEVDIEIDERLCAHPDKSGRLLGAKPSADGELWVPYLEKAVAAHCGGWDKITGGQCTHGWALLTGCPYQYTIRKEDDTGKFSCWGKYDPDAKEWMTRRNSPHDSDARMWENPWPSVGGGGAAGSQLTEEELFMRMCAWDDENYIIAAGITTPMDEGLVDTHAYSVIECLNDVAGTVIDLLKVRK